MAEQGSGRIAFKFWRHAIHESEPGCWFRPKDYRISGHNFFLADEKIKLKIGALSTSGVRVAKLLEGGGELHIMELYKADRARKSWLNDQFVKVANYLHKEACAKPKEEFRFDSLHIENGEWLARFVRKSTGEYRDITQAEVETRLKSALKIEEFRALLYGPFPASEDERFCDYDLIHAVSLFKDIEPEAPPVLKSTLLSSDHVPH